MMDTTTQIWDFEGYWLSVMGQRTEAQLIAEFNLVAEGLHEWIGTCEEAAIEQGAGPREETLEAWAPHHAQALEAITRALEAAR